MLFRKEQIGITVSVKRRLRIIRPAKPACGRSELKRPAMRRAQPDLPLRQEDQRAQTVREDRGSLRQIRR